MSKKGRDVLWKIRQKIGRGAQSFILVFAAMLSMAGCVTDVANRYYLSERYPSKNEEQVEVLTSTPSRPYVVMADFQARGDSVEGVRRKAAEIGADAVIVSKLGGSYDLREQWAGEDRFNSTGSRVVGTAVRYTSK